MRSSNHSLFPPNCRGRTSHQSQNKHPWNTHILPAQIPSFTSQYSSSLTCFSQLLEELNWKYSLMEECCWKDYLCMQSYSVSSEVRQAVSPGEGWRREHFKAPSTRTKQVLSLLWFSVHIPVSRNNRLWISWGIPAGKTRYSETGIHFKETKYFMSSPSRAKN